MKALGIIAMIFSIVAIFTPIIGPYLTFVCALLAAFSAGPGVTFGLVAIGINIINIVFLSPTLWVASGIVAMSQKSGSGSSAIAETGAVFIGAQIVAAIVLLNVHSNWKKKHDGNSPQAVHERGSTNEQTTSNVQDGGEKTGGSPALKGLTDLWESGSISESEYKKRIEELDVTGALKTITGLWEAGAISESEYRKRKERLVKKKK